MTKPCQTTETHGRRMARKNVVYMFLLGWTIVSLGLFTYHLSKHTNMRVGAHSDHQENFQLSSVFEYKRTADDVTNIRKASVVGHVVSKPHVQRSPVPNIQQSCQNSTTLPNEDKKGTNAGLNKKSKSKQTNNYVGKIKNETRTVSNDAKIAHVNTRKSTKKSAKQVVINSFSKRIRENIQQRMLKYKRRSNEKRRPLPRADERLRTQNVYKHDLQYLKYMKCPTTLRHKMSRRPALKGKYVKDVPILLTREHVTDSEYNRLKVFRDMMGWKGSKFEVILKTMDLLKTSRNQYLFDDRLVNDKVVNGNCIRCAVVGNGGILNGSRMGREIDSHDYVFRTNVAITKGHEDDVGNKTSFYCFGMKTLSGAISGMKNKGFSAPPWNPKIRYVFLPEDDWAYRYIYAALTHGILPKGRKERYAKREPFVFPKPLVPEDIKIIHPDFCRYIDNSWLRSLKLRRVGRATTGAIMIFLALHTCDEVNAYGFMGDPNKFTFHYYDQNFTKSNGLTRVFWHDWDKENALWKLLIKEGIFHMYTRN
ncbi:alpha-N-acetylgalactosaminide alpha-2,6-sialyltransferase 2-like [Amphiura filiformis]|uniref:alpha-N-acetylgalactosaminide alpha-2,6-sialyltransferase 2-like n=1 Tax=Amphiura filiformis TaxID=82378 RepID=UPI003B211DD3